MNLSKLEQPLITSRFAPDPLMRAPILLRHTARSVTSACGQRFQARWCHRPAWQPSAGFPPTTVTMSITTGRPGGGHGPRRNRVRSRCRRPWRRSVVCHPACQQPVPRLSSQNDDCVFICRDNWPCSTVKVGNPSEIKSLSARPDAGKVATSSWKIYFQ